MAGRSCSRWELPVRCDLWRLWVDPLRAAERIEIAGESVEYPATAATRDRLAFSRVTWDSHLYRFNAGLPPRQVAPSSSFETRPTLFPGWPATCVRLGPLRPRPDLGRGSRRVERTPAHPQRAPMARLACLVARRTLYRVRQQRRWRPGSHLDHRRRWRHAAPDHGRTGQPVGPQVVARRQVDLFLEPSDSDARYLAGARDGRATATGDPDRQRLLGYEFGYRYRVSSISRSTETPPLLMLPIAAGAGPRRLVDCVRSAAFAPAGRTVVYVRLRPSSRPPLRVIDPVSGNDRLLGRLENFPPGGTHVNLAVSPDGTTVLFRGFVGRGGDVMLIEDFR